MRACRARWLTRNNARAALSNAPTNSRQIQQTAYDLNRRLAQHRAGSGAAIMRAVCERGIPFFVARTWPGGRRLERQLKRRKNSPRLCPACVPATWERPEPEVDDKEAALEVAAELELERVLEDAHFGGGDL